MCEAERAGGAMRKVAGAHVVMTLLLGVALSAQGREVAQVSPSPLVRMVALSPTEAEAASQIVLSWLECEECFDGQLEAVIRLGREGVPSLAIALREGPSRASQAALRHHLILSYRQALQSGSPHHMTEAEYIRQYLGNYSALYQIRAVRALSLIGGPEALAVLQNALSLDLPDHVERAVRTALAGLKAFSP
jgi:hypothetical protein